MVRLTYPNLVSLDPVYQWVQDELTPLLAKIRANRRPMEERWKRYGRLRRATLDAMSYHGRSKLYIPAGKKVIETMVISLCDSLLPFSDWFSVTPIEHVTDEDRARAMHALHKHFLTTSVRLPFHLPTICDQLVTYGTSPTKIGWADEERTIRRYKTVRDAMTGASTVRLVTEAVKALYGPTLRPMDLFSWFLWPETVADVEDAVLVFEDKEVPKSSVRRLGTVPMDPARPDLGMVYERVDVALDEDAQPANFKLARRERLQVLGISQDPAQRYMGMPRDHCVLTEIYYAGEIPGAMEQVYDEGGDLVDEREIGPSRWLLAVIGDTWPVRVQRNPFFRETVPHLVPRINRVVDEFYGHATCENFDRLNYMFNDICNQTMDGLQMTLNPIVQVNPLLHTRPNSIRWVPGAKWIGPPEAFHMDRAPDVTPTGFNAMNQLQAWIGDYGLNPFAMGQPAAQGRGRSQNTATGLQTLLATGQQPIGAMAKDIEMQLTVPLLQRMADYYEQFLTEPVMIRVLGVGAGPILQRRVSAEDVVGDYLYSWNGTSLTRERVILATQMMQMLPNLVQLMTLPGVADQLQPDIAYILRRIWTDGLNLHGADLAFKTPLPSIDPDLEHDILAEERPIVVSPGDNDPQHLQVHQQRGLPRFRDDPILLQQLLVHMQQHQQQAQAKQQAQMAQLQQQLAQQQGATPPNGGPPVPQRARPQNQPTSPVPQLADLARMTGGGMQ